jgi:two-component system LytT family sensor kinase
MTRFERPKETTSEPRPSFRTFRPWMLVSAAWIGPAILAILDAYVQSNLGQRSPVQLRVLLWQGGDWLLFGAFTPIVFYLGRRLPLQRRHLLPRIALHLFAALAVCALWAASGTILRWLLLPGGAGIPTADFAVSWFFTTLPFGVAVYFAVLGIEHGIFYFTEARDQAERTARLSQLLAEARLGALRMQLNPHFLLNSLNAITVLVRDANTPAATWMLEELGELLREVLRADRSHEVPLAREIDFVKRYLGIEQVRFSDRLRPIFEVDLAVLNAAVPHFVLQPLVENALRHAIARRVEAGLVQIAARREGDDLVLSVRDDGPGLDKDTGRKAAGVGLANTRERLTTLYGSRGRLELIEMTEGGALATIRIPFHPAATPGEVTGGS